jgi:sugar/nucleoside kinase (ribokinase family)
MSPFDHITTTLTGRAPWPFKAFKALTQDDKKPESKTERIRRYLREKGAATAETLADEADVPSTGLVGALLKADLHRGSVFRRGHKYHWNPQFDIETHKRLAEAASLLRANGYQVKKVQR